AAILDDPPERNPLAEAEAGLAVLLPHPLERVAGAARHLEREIVARRERMEQPHADAGLGSVADHAQELAAGTDQLGRADQQREARCGAHFRATLGLVRLKRPFFVAQR